MNMVGPVRRSRISSVMPARTPVRSFVDLEAWQRARELHRAVCAATDGPAFRRNLRLSDRTRASAASTMANIAEGFERASRAQFHQSLCIAKGEAGETLSHIFAAFDAGCLDQARSDALRDLAMRSGQLIGGLRKAVDRSRQTR